MSEPTQTRQCGKCKQVLPVDRFRVWTERKNGKQHVTSFCKACKYQQKRQWENRNQSKVKEYQQRQDAKNRPMVESRIQAREKAKGDRDERARQVNTMRDIRTAIAHVRERLIPEGNAMRKGLRWCRYCKRDVTYLKSSGKCGRCDYKLYAKAAFARKPKHEVKAMRARRYAARKRDPVQMLKQRIRDRISKAMTRYASGHVKTGSNLKYLGCSAPQLAQYIERMFKRGMAWSNYGDWHLDHVVPLASFELTTERNRIKAFHYTNLQPLWAADNILKSDNMPSKAHQPMLLLA
jgi:hypothetical protein